MLEIYVSKNSPVLRAVKKTPIYGHVKKSISEIQNPLTKKFFKSAANNPVLELIRGDYGEMEKYISYIYEVLQKLKMCNDKNVLAELNKFISVIYKETTSLARDFIINTDISWAEQILDKANIKNNKYSTLYNKHDHNLNILDDLKNKDYYKNLENNISQIKDDTLKKCLVKAKGALYYSTVDTAKEDIERFNDFIRNYNECKDSTIKKHIFESVTSTIGMPAQDTYESILKNNLLLSAVNIADSKYSPLFTYKFNTSGSDFYFYKHYLQYIKEDVTQSEARTKDYQESVFGYFSPQRQGYRLYKDKKIKSFNENKFREHSKLGYIKDFIINNPKEESVNKYLWEKYFVSKIKEKSKNSSNSDKIVQKLYEIENELKVKIFYDKQTPDTLSLLEKLHNGLSNIKQSEDVTMPRIIDITSYNNEIISKQNKYGYYIDGKYVQFLNNVYEV